MLSGKSFKIDRELAHFFVDNKFCLLNLWEVSGGECDNYINFFASGYFCFISFFSGIVLILLLFRIYPSCCFLRSNIGFTR